MLMEQLQGNNALNGGCLLIDQNNGIARGHHHLNGKAGVVTIPGFFFRSYVERKHLSDFSFFSFWYDELKNINRWPGIMLI